jgi:hypothetical protein
VKFAFIDQHRGFLPRVHLRRFWLSRIEIFVLGWAGRRPTAFSLTWFC